MCGEFGYHFLLILNINFISNILTKIGTNTVRKLLKMLQFNFKYFQSDPLKSFIIKYHSHKIVLFLNQLYPDLVQFKGKTFFRNSL